MEFDIGKFATNIGSTPLMRSSHFLVTMSRPKILDLTGWRQEQMISMLCRSVTTPGVGLQTSEEKPYGQGTAYKFPVDAIHGDVTLTFYVDSQYNTYDFFLAWIKGITPSLRDPKSQFNGLYDGEMRYREDYIADLDIWHYTENSRVAKFTLYDAYPINMTEMTLDWSLGEELAIFTVTFTYRAFSLKKMNDRVTVSRFQGPPGVDSSVTFGDPIPGGFRETTGVFREFPQYGPNPVPTGIGEFFLSDDSNPIYQQPNMTSATNRIRFSSVSSAFDAIASNTVSVGSIIAVLDQVRTLSGSINSLNSTLNPFIDLIRSAGTNIASQLLNFLG